MYHVVKDGNWCQTWYQVCSDQNTTQSLVCLLACLIAFTLQNIYLTVSYYLWDYAVVSTSSASTLGTSKKKKKTWSSSRSCVSEKKVFFVIEHYPSLVSPTTCLSSVSTAHKKYKYVTYITTTTTSTNSTTTQRRFKVCTNLANLGSIYFTTRQQQIHSKRSVVFKN